METQRRAASAAAKSGGRRQVRLPMRQGSEVVRTGERRRQTWREARRRNIVGRSGRGVSMKCAEAEECLRLRSIGGLGGGLMARPSSGRWRPPDRGRGGAPDHIGNLPSGGLPGAATPLLGGVGRCPFAHPPGLPPPGSFWGFPPHPIPTSTPRGFLPPGSSLGLPPYPIPTPRAGRGMTAFKPSPLAGWLSRWISPAPLGKWQGMTEV